MTDDDRILIEILAATDAVFLPSRKPDMTRHRVICERRRGFRDNGVVWASGGQRAMQRQVEALISAELIQSCGAGGRTRRVRLTDQGDDRARAVARLPCAWESLAAVNQLIAHRKKTGEFWIRETVLAGVEYGRDNWRELLEVNCLMLPAVVRGWAESNCSTYGLAFYSVTDEGKKAARKKVTDVGPEGKLADPLALDFYLDRLNVEYDALNDAKPDDPKEIGEIPIPAFL